MIIKRKTVLLDDANDHHSMFVMLSFHRARLLQLLALQNFQTSFITHSIRKTIYILLKINIVTYLSNATHHIHDGYF